MMKAKNMHIEDGMKFSTWKSDVANASAQAHFKCKGTASLFAIRSQSSLRNVMLISPLVAQVNAYVVDAKIGQGDGSVGKMSKTSLYQPCTSWGTKNGKDPSCVQSRVQPSADSDGRRRTFRIPRGRAPSRSKPQFGMADFEGKSGQPKRTCHRS